MRSLVLHGGLLLALLPLLISAPSGALILCSGADGHVTLKLAQPETASPAAGFATAATFGPDCYCDTGCGPCEDTDVGLVQTISRPPESRSVDSPVLLRARVAMDLDPSTRTVANELTQTATALLPAMCAHLEQSTIRLLV